MGRARIHGRRVLCALVGAAAAFALAPGVARAGDWVQVSCVNPNGSIAPSQGWSTLSTGSPEPGSNASTGCGPGSPMSAFLSAQSAAPVAIAGIGTSEALQYTPPAGSTLAGGSLNANLYGDSWGPNPDGSGATGSGDALVFSPSFAFGSQIFMCAWTTLPTSGCAPGPSAAYSGIVTIPPNLGGDLYLAAACGGNPNGGVCDQNPSENAWSFAQVVSADVLLFNGAVPAASGFGGSLLSPNASGAADVSFTATDSAGPGVYSVTVKVDGTVVYASTPQTESGHCVSVGTQSGTGALMFDWQQPCPTTEFVDIPVNTAGLSDGQHRLTVSVADAAQNATTVLDQSITTRQAGTGTVTTPPPPSPHHLRATLLIVSRFSGRHTRLVSIRARNLPRDADITVACHGRHCPRPKARSGTAAKARRLWKALTRDVFTAGQRVIFTFTAPGFLPERTEILIRRDAKPVPKRL